MLISVPRSCSFLVAVLELAVCVPLRNWGCPVCPRAWPVHRDDALTILSLECRELLEVWEYLSVPEASYRESKPEMSMAPEWVCCLLNPKGSLLAAAF